MWTNIFFFLKTFLKKSLRLLLWRPRYEHSGGELSDGFSVRWRPAPRHHRGYAVREIQPRRPGALHSGLQRHDHPALSRIRLCELLPACWRYVEHAWGSEHVSVSASFTGPINIKILFKIGVYTAYMVIFPDYLTHISMTQFLNILSNICQGHKWNWVFLNIWALAEFSHLFQAPFKRWHWNLLHSVQ